MLSSPEGMISVKGFQDIFADLTVLTHGTGMVPDIWLNIPQDKVSIYMKHFTSINNYSCNK